MTASRRLAAILATDVAGYSRLIGADEGDTLTRLKAIRAELIDPTIAAHNGRLVKTTGDALLVEFGSVVEVLRWGLVPYWAKDLKVGFANINAKAEGIENRPAFREAFQRRRWVVERTFSWFGRNRRLAKDFENLAAACQGVGRGPRYTMAKVGKSDCEGTFARSSGNERDAP